MATIESVIKTNPLGRWYIEISDVMEESSTEVCLDIEEYAKKIEAMGKPYEGNIEVVWSSDKDVSDMQINEVRQQIIAYEAENRV
jgi:hypothetical protein